MTSYYLVYVFVEIKLNKILWKQTFQLLSSLNHRPFSLNSNKWKTILIGLPITAITVIKPVSSTKFKLETDWHPKVQLLPIIHLKKLFNSLANLILWVNLMIVLSILLCYTNKLNSELLLWNIKLFGQSQIEILFV